jgi:2,4-dienoyl-CoA reductase-like NADH-dependent reductase (Old Yellow Enzyme family)
VTEGVYTDDAYSKGYLKQPGLVAEHHVDAWRQVVDTVHDAGAPVFAQLMHCGAQTQGIPPSHDEEAIAPSPIQPNGEKSESYGGKGPYPVPERATQEDFVTAREGFVSAVKNAHRAGFDGIEIHGANGYFLNEFLSTTMNKRDDEYGGGPEARVRYPTEVVSGIADAVPNEFIVAIRISQTMVTDDAYEWPEGEDAGAVFFTKLANAGADYVHTTEPDATTPTFGSDGPTLAEAAIKYATDDTVVLDNGGLGTPEAARDALDSGADLLTLATGALANPDWSERVARGQELADFDWQRFLTPTACISDEELSISTSHTDR